MSNDFMQNHPTLGGALNNALFAAAGTETARGASGAGTGISNVLRGVAGVPQAENQFQLQQQMQPFQMAEAMSKLYGQTASAQENLARAGWFSDRSGNQQLAIQQRADAAKAKFASPQYDQDNKLVGYMTPDGFLSAKDAGVPDNAQIYRPDPAGRGGNPTITSLAADVANGVPGAAARLKAAINANNQVAGGRQGAVNNANTPEKLLTSETQATLDQVGAAPKNAHADYQSYQAKQLMSGVPFEQVQDEATWSAQNTAKYNTAKAAAQQDVSNYTQSKAWQQGISLQQWKAIRARTALTPGVSQQAAPAGVPGTAQPQQAQRSNVQVGSKVTLKNGQTVTVTKLNNDGTFEHN
ncbi:MAG TPA: hypothetical protein VLA42_18235 [Verrucomicrobiae bacterium]|nr:hypothetical protein [Verrucomicrobiae bacterium]